MRYKNVPREEQEQERSCGVPSKKIRKNRDRMVGCVLTKLLLTKGT